MTWVGRIGVVVLRPIAYFVTYRLCLGLQHHDREVLEHGIETGIIRRLPSGEFIEVHQPLGPVTTTVTPLAYGGAPVPKRMNHLGAARRAVRGFFCRSRRARPGPARAAPPRAGISSPAHEPPQELEEVLLPATNCSPTPQSNRRGPGVGVVCPGTWSFRFVSCFLFFLGCSHA